MNDVDKALATQLANIQQKTGKTLDELTLLVRASGRSKHGEIRDWLKSELGLGHGDANTLTHTILKSDGQSAAEGKTLTMVYDEIYAGPHAPLRPIHDTLLARIETFGAFEIAPKKGYVSLRRKKQFAMIGPATKTQVEVGLNARDLPPAPRLTPLPAGGMCQYRVRIASVDEVDEELMGWIRRAFDSA